MWSRKPLAIVGALLLGAGLAFAAATASRPKVGDPFPSLASGKFEGPALPNTQGKVVLLDFWASWCGPCKQELPFFKSLHEKYAAQGLVVIAISEDEDKADMDAFLKKNPLPFTVVRDLEGKYADSVGVEGVPVTFLIDRTGKVSAIHAKWDGERTRKEYEATLQVLLKQ